MRSLTSGDRAVGAEEMSLSEFLAVRRREFAGEDELLRPVIVFDQFEELFSVTTCDSHQERDDIFRQLSHPKVDERMRAAVHRSGGSD